MADKKLNKWLYMMPAIIWALVLAVLMLLPQESFPESKLLSYDKLAHLGVFAILSGLLLFGALKTKVLGKTKTSLLVRSLTISIVYSAGLEFLQQFSPGRSTDIYDLVANVAGAIFGVLVFYIFNKNKFAIYKLML
ncbi:VanZ family protein [Roseivirga sp. E12]|uniref:VanZ family protein n=1 Tax=Roseivirga sp. E12 TaxID=2819237 RepID=UPI001ABBF6F7|nr:VanZ family protein [Roseivirga sp. E12]